MMTEYTIHNVRFYDFEPKAIQCMAFENSNSRLALSRADGSIEIWNCLHRPVLQHVLPAPDSEASVEGLAWCKGRLFSVGLHGFVLEHDLTLCTIKSRTAVTGGPTWCVALSPNQEMLAAGTEEGYVCLFDVCDDGIMYNKTLDKQEGRILSIAWHRSGDYIATGSINCVRLWSLKEGRVTRCSFAHGKRQEIIVWCVTILENKTIVSGDSRGTLCFWDTEVGTLLESVHTHKADILCLAKGLNDSYIFAAGVDPVITKVCCTTTGGKAGKKSRWIPQTKFRNHSHDIRALALSSENTVYSGGVDTVLGAIYQSPKMILKIPTPLYPGHVSVGVQSESLLLRYKERVELWRLGQPGEPKSAGNYLPMTEDRVKMLELQCNDGESIQWCALSPKGLWIAYVVKQGIKVFQFFPPSTDRQVSIRRVRAMSKEIESSRQVLWLMEGKLASLTLSGTIQIISVSDMEATVENTLKPTNCVLRMVSGQDGNILVVVDDQQIVTAHYLNEDTYISLPVWKSPVTALGINPTSKCIVIAYADGMIKEYDLKIKRYTASCNQFIMKPGKEAPKLNSVIMNVSFDPADDSLITLHDDESIIVLKKSSDDTESCQENKIHRGHFYSQNGRKNSHNMESERKGSIFKPVISQYNVISRSYQVLYFSHVKDKRAISIELDPVQLHDKLPPTLKVKKYGGM